MIRVILVFDLSGGGFYTISQGIANITQNELSWMVGINILGIPCVFFTVYDQM